MSYRGCVISLDPLVVMSNCNSRMPFGIGQAMPDLFDGQDSLHFINPSGALQTFSQVLQETYFDVARRLPRAHFVFMANEEADLLLLQSLGFAAVLASTYLFLDERVFCPMSVEPKNHDALYNANFRPLKNHQLCRDIRSLALIHYYHPTLTFPEDGTHEADMRKLLAHADILNEEGGAAFRWLSLHEVAVAANRAWCGLMLSDSEGAVRACAEYLMCGVPVVSVPSTGGRQRYLTSENSRIVAGSADAVAAAVAALKDLKPDSHAIRRDFMTIINFERRSFLAVVNGYSEQLLGHANLVEGFDVFRAANHFRPEEEWRRWLSP
jgi:glycosyltransferase involved in cell wall biosynthesis